MAFVESMNKEEQFEPGNALPNIEFLQLTFGRLGDGVIWLNRDGQVVFANEAACRSLECTSEEMLTYRVPDFDPNFSDADWREHWLDVKTRHSFTIETLHRSKGGRVFPVEVTVNYFVYGDNEFNCAIVRDISARKEMEESMRLAAAIYMSSNEAVLVADENNRIIQINPAFTRITGYTLEDLYGKNPSILQSGMQDEESYRGMWQGIMQNGCWQGELWDRCKNGDLVAYWVTISLLRHPDGSVYRYVAQFMDITEKKIKEDLVWKYANYDMLTGLPNRRLFFDRLEQEVKKASRAGGQLSVMFIDLDGFKQVNDRFGHDQGDLLLTEAAHRIGRCVRETDTVARLGGDEFTILLMEVGGRSYTDRIVKAIHQKLGEPFILGADRGSVSASIGVAFYPDDAQDAAGLVKRADRAMYKAKDCGRSCHVYASKFV